MLYQEFFLYFLIFILGASLASFILVCIERGNKDKFFSLKNKSICQNCLRKLNFFELVPVFSYLLLKGKCKTCKTKIPAKLFIGEITLGVWFLVSYFYFQPTSIFVLILCWIFGSVFFLLSLEDFENMEVSIKFLYFLLFIAFIVNILNAKDFLDFLVPVLITLPFWLISFLKKDWLGEADPYIFTSVGLFFGTQFLISTILYSVWFGAAYGIFHLAFINKKFEHGVQIPFVPIIFFSTLFVLIFNYHIIKVSDILFIYESFHLG